MKDITITVKVGDNEIYRNYEGGEHSSEELPDLWGDRIIDMLDTLEKSNEKEF